MRQKSAANPSATTLDAILDDFTRSWERGEQPRAERYLGLLLLEESAELIYHEFCLAEASDLDPDPAEYLLRFPEQADSLSRLFALHGVISPSTLQGWVSPTELPASGDEIGPYRLVRELGRGAFARVFLAEQSDLDHRLVVLKVSTRSTAEPRLLARARHVHIVEVLRHAVAEDGALHLVCMPFLGGATLASVLEEGRRRGRRRPRSGVDLLADLDRVSAPEYPPTEMARPARELIARQSHAQGMAWIVARLAEALDHAHRRGVAHGDLKPSNVLLTAEASPLLLDFNLSVDWRDAGPDDPATEPGGTLAYMAPERLEAIARGGRDRPQTAADLHRADLYALGLLLLEALTGQPPEVPRRRTGDPRDLAAELALLRRTLPEALRSAGDRLVPPGLRSILERCLARAPVDRYARGNDLAEDLDRWRTDRSLAFASETRSSNLNRQVRRQRATFLVLGLSMSLALGVTWLASLVLQGTRRDQALASYSRITDRADSGVFGFRQEFWRPDELGEPIELAARQLARYDVLNDPNWRVRDDIQSLPDRERGELEVWLFEQILRYAAALGETPGSPESWKRGLALLDRTLAQVDSAPLQAQRGLLLEQLGLPDRARGGPSVPRLPGWMDVYLAGIAAEPLHARDAMGLYLEALKQRPDLFWAHYRTAVVACRINEYELASQHLQICSRRSPANPALHALLASVLYSAYRDMLDHFDHDVLGEALAECDESLRLDPDFAPGYWIKAMIHSATRQRDSMEADLDRYAAIAGKSGSAAVLSTRFWLTFRSGSDFWRLPEAGRHMARRILERNPDDGRTRMKLASSLVRLGRLEEALDHLEQMIERHPDHLVARFLRAERLLEIDRPAAIEELDRLIDHPRFEEVFPFLPVALRAYHHVAEDLMERGKIVEALEVTYRGLWHVKQCRALFDETLVARDKISKQLPFAPRGQTLFLLARLHFLASRSDTFSDDDRARHEDHAIDYLRQTFAIHPAFREDLFANERLFDEIRDVIDWKLAATGSP